jgi:hypothetical protein
MIMQPREMLALGAAILSATVAAARLVPGGERSSVTVPTAVAPSNVSGVDDDSLGAAADNTVTNDPFRLVNRPASVRYEVRLEAGGAMAAPPAPRPQLVLRAIVGGPPWQAVVDGLPGQQPGVIVRSGDSYDKITVRSVGRDTVVIQAKDTTWKLTLGQGTQ